MYYVNRWSQIKNIWGGGGGGGGGPTKFKIQLFIDNIIKYPESDSSLPLKYNMYISYMSMLGLITYIIYNSLYVTEGVKKVSHGPIFLNCTYDEDSKSLNNLQILWKIKHLELKEYVIL